MNRSVMPTPPWIAKTLVILAITTFVTPLFGQDKNERSDSKLAEKVDANVIVNFQPGKQIKNRITVTSSDGESRELGYWLYTPANYEAVESAPWMMFLHGMGERGNDLELVKKWGPPKRVATDEDFPFVLISPQCPGDIVWKTDYLIQILDAVEGAMKVDTKRLYMTGLSMGGFGTWAMTAKIPERIAASVPVCGGGKVEDAEKMVAVPIWAFHGSADRVVPLKRSQEMIDAVKQAGGNAKLTTYDEVGHNSWSKTYANDEVYRWLLEHHSDRK